MKKTKQNACNFKFGKSFWKFKYSCVSIKELPIKILNVYEEID
jgi:hypothetical protein